LGKRKSGSREGAASRWGQPRGQTCADGEITDRVFRCADENLLDLREDVAPVGGSWGEMPVDVDL
jgi:hypothetical protein